ncbi:MAG: hypothetical protein AB1478_00100 [Nitrospirota bacterium]
MSRVILGTNLIEDCGTVMTISGTPLFSYKVEPDEVKLSFNIPSPPANTEVRVEDNVICRGNVVVKADQNSATISHGDVKLLHLSIEGDTAIVHLDLRPLGLRIYTDSNALHIGSSQLSQNIIKQCTNGIAIG